MSSSATGVGMTICFLGAILLILTQKSSQVTTQHPYRKLLVNKA